MRVMGAVLLLTACSAALPPPARLVCYAVADARAQARVDVECPAGGLEECPWRDEILAELQSAQEACE